MGSRKNTNVSFINSQRRLSYGKQKFVSEMEWTSSDSNKNQVNDGMIDMEINEDPLEEVSLILSRMQALADVYSKAAQGENEPTPKLYAESNGLNSGFGPTTYSKTAMGTIDSALENMVRSRVNRGFLHSLRVSNMRNINMNSENISSTDNRIKDVDVAQETSFMTSFQILQHAGVSMLASANMSIGQAEVLLT